MGGRVGIILSYRSLGGAPGAPGPGKTTMSLPFEAPCTPADPRGLQILAKTIYRELRASGFSEEDVMQLAGELLSRVAEDVRGGRRADRA